MLKKPLLNCFLFAMCFLSLQARSQGLTCPPNLDFETGGLNNWEFFIGSCCPANANIATAPTPGRHTITTGAGVDPYGGFPVVAPNGGQFSLKLGNDGVNAQAERARYYVQVPANQNNIYTLLYSYAVVFEDPSHTAADQPRFEVTVYDSATGVPAPCNQFQFVAASALPGFQLAPVKSPRGVNVFYKPWSTASIDLSQMAGRTVAIDFTTGDCAQGGHAGYAYIDAACNFFQSYTLHCPNTSTYTLIGPPGFAMYDWRDASNTTIGTTQNITVPTPATNSTFSVIVSPYNGFGCPDTIYSTFTITNMNVDITLDTAICVGEGVQLNSGTNSSAGPYTYLWDPPTGLSCSNCDDPLASPLTDTRYYVTITDRDGCKAIDSVRVRVDAEVNINIEVGDTFCAKTFIDIKNNATNPPGTQYLWNLNDDMGDIADGIATPDILGVWYSEGRKKIKLSLINGRCTSHDSTYVYINRKPQPFFEIFKNVCVGTPVLLKAKQEENTTYHWKIDEQNVTETNYQEAIWLQWNTVGKKKIILTNKHENGCETTTESYIGIQAYPEASINVVNADNLCYGKAFELEATSTYRYDYSWRPAQYFTNNTAARVSGKAETSGFVYVDVTNQWDCMVTDSFWVNADPCCDIFMPDAFTPDNNGRNDTYWSPDLYKHTLVHLMIANRRGQIVYETKSADKGWDGTYKGQPSIPDTYNYYIKYRCNDKEEMTKKGTLMLLR